MNRKYYFIEVTNLEVTKTYFQFLIKSREDFDLFYEYFSDNDYFVHTSRIPEYEVFLDSKSEKVFNETGFLILVANGESQLTTVWDFASLK